MIQTKLKKQQLQLEKQLALLQLDKEHVCIVGSFVLALKNIRQNRDLDIIILPKFKKRISKKKKAFNITRTIEVVGNNWASTIGINDESIINDSRFYNLINGFKVVIPEILFLVMLFRGREKNIQDLELLEKYALHTKHWDWSLIRNVIPKSKTHDFKIKKTKKKHIKISKDQILEYENITLGQLSSTRWSWILLWPPAKPWFDEISQELSKFSTKKWEKSIHLGKSLPNFIRKIYSIDDIQKWKVELKINAMQDFEPIIRIIAMEFPSDTFRIKKDVHAYQSKTAVYLKKLIRKNFGKKIPDYFYDIIIHIGDNHKHNREIYKILDEYNYLK